MTSIKYTTSFGHDFLIPNDTIYLDSATIGKLPKESLVAISKYLCECEGFQSSGTHRYSICATDELEKARTSISNFFKVNESSLSFSYNLETMLTNILFSYKVNKKSPNIITSMLEDNSIIAPIIKGKKALEYKINYLTPEDEANLVEAIKSKISTDNSLLILSSLTLAAGTKRDWVELVKLAKDLDISLILDISRTVGHEPIFFDKHNPDIVLCNGSVGALGPAGTAFQIVSSDINEELDPLLIGGGSVAELTETNYSLLKGKNKFEYGTLNIPGIVGLSKSLQVIEDIGLNRIQEKENKLIKKIDKELREIEALNIIDVAEEKAERGAIFAFYSDKIESFDLTIILEDMNNIILRAGSLCSFMFMNKLKIKNVVQLSTHLYNNEKQIDKLIENINEVVSQF